MTPTVFNLSQDTREKRIRPDILGKADGLMSCVAPTSGVARFALVNKYKGCICYYTYGLADKWFLSLLVAKTNVCRARRPMYQFDQSS